MISIGVVCLTAALFWFCPLVQPPRPRLVLASVLRSRQLGVRPITLIGFSLGARVIFYALVRIAKVGGYGIVQDVFLLGATLSVSTSLREQTRSVVSMASSADTGNVNTVAGLRPIEGVQGLENVDITEKVMWFSLCLCLWFEFVEFECKSRSEDNDEDAGGAEEEGGREEEECGKSASHLPYPETTWFDFTDRGSREAREVVIQGGSGHCSCLAIDFLISTRFSQLRALSPLSHKYDGSVGLNAATRTLTNVIFHPEFPTTIQKKEEEKNNTGCHCSSSARNSPSSKLRSQPSTSALCWYQSCVGGVGEQGWEAQDDDCDDADAEFNVDNGGWLVLVAAVEAPRGKGGGTPNINHPTRDISCFIVTIIMNHDRDESGGGTRAANDDID
ncbi:hypothetical protein EV368DRAFT_70042 [Lentinula lateritia]|nr:hypothetical protein EV368DRAFT_70042 [Lentinula lateritia]